MSIDTPTGEKPGAKDVFNLVKKSPALLFTGIVAVLLIGYILIKNSQQNSGAAATPPDTLTGTVSPGGYDNNIPQAQPQPQPIIVIPTPTPGPTPAPGGTPTPAPGATVPSNNYQDDIVRTRYGNPTANAYDTNNPQGVPIHNAPSVSAPGIGYAGFGSKITITGPAVSGTSNVPLDANKGTTFWYPVAGGGYISAFDVQSSFPAATTTATVPSNS